MKKDGETVVETKLNAFRKLCEETGIRLTHQRLELFREICMAEDHPSAEDIYERIRTKLPTISMDTVYRTLATFERHDLVAKLQVLGEKGRFDPNTSPHGHLICIRCKEIKDFSWPAFDELELPSPAREWGRISGKYAEVRVLCTRCQQAERANNGKLS